MTHHFRGRIGQYITAIALFIAISIIGLWAWNTLAGLFDLPIAQYKHALAAIALALIVKTVFFHTTRHPHHREVTE